MRSVLPATWFSRLGTPVAPVGRQPVSQGAVGEDHSCTLSKISVQTASQMQSDASPVWPWSALNRTSFTSLAKRKLRRYRYGCAFALTVVAGVPAFSLADTTELDINQGAVEEQDEFEDPWLRITREDEWQPGKVGEHNSTNPTKDMECLGPKTAMVGDPSLTWAEVKGRLHHHLPAGPLEDQWLLRASMNIQRDEPDNCVLGVTTTSAFLLPVTMPKFRNMARVLSSDQNLLVLNVTFYDTLRSGFPIFGIIDMLSSADYRDWFHGDESRLYFAERPLSPACTSKAANELLGELMSARRGQTWLSGTPLAPALTWLADGGAAASGGCPLASAAALLICALSRAELAPMSGTGRDAALRDVIELVSKAEEQMRDYSAQEVVQFGELVATPWNVWWLLHRLQRALPKRLFRAQADTMWATLGSAGNQEL